MRRLLCNQVSFVLAGIVLQAITFKPHHGVRCEELRENSESFVKPYFRKLRKDLLDSFPKTDEFSYHVNYRIDFDDTLRRTGGFLRRFTEAVFPESGEQELPVSGDSEVDSENGLTSTTVSPESKELFTDLDTAAEKAVEKEQTQQKPVSKTQDTPPPSKSDKPKCNHSELFSILKNLKLMFSFPIKIVHTKRMEPSKKNTHEVAYCCEPFT